MTRYIYSLDYDGCIAEESLEFILEHNQDLIDELVALIKAGHEVILCVGSNRQDIHKDYLNSTKMSGKSPSVFSAIPAIVHRVRELAPQEANLISFDGILSIDWQKKTKPGTHFSLYSELEWVKTGQVPDRKADCPGKNEPKQKSDETKISTLYAQIHYFAQSGNPQIFTFSDDKPDLLTDLFNFYSQNAHLIPKNVTLQFKQKFSHELAEARENEEGIRSAYPIVAFNSIQGQGEVDLHYDETAKAMHVLADKIGSQDESIEPSQLMTNIDDLFEQLHPQGYEERGYKDPKYIPAFNEYLGLKQMGFLMKFSIDHPHLFAVGKGLLAALLVVAIAGLAVGIGIALTNPVVGAAIVAVVSAIPPSAGAAVGSAVGGLGVLGFCFFACSDRNEEALEHSPSP